MSSSNGRTVLSFGSNTIELFLPQRRPLVMVDRVEAFEDGPPPALETSRYISANEPIFDGHFPDLHLWPGVYTIEGMGQSCALLVAMLAVRNQALCRNSSDHDAFAALQNLELGFRMRPGFRADLAAQFSERARAYRHLLSVSAAVNVKLMHPVFAGERLDYRVSLAQELDTMMRFDVEAFVAGRTVAQGTMTGAKVARHDLAQATAG